MKMPVTIISLIIIVSVFCAWSWGKKKAEAPRETAFTRAGSLLKDGSVKNTWIYLEKFATTHKGPGVKPMPYTYYLDGAVAARNFDVFEKNAIYNSTNRRFYFYAAYVNDKRQVAEQTARLFKAEKMTASPAITADLEAGIYRISHGKILNEKDFLQKLNSLEEFEYTLVEKDKKGGGAAFEIKIANDTSYIYSVKDALYNDITKELAFTKAVLSYDKDGNFINITAAVPEGE